MGRKNSTQDLAIASRRCQVATLYRQSIHTQAEIAKQVKVDRSTVSRDLAAIKKRWQQASADDWHTAVGKELDRLHLVERNAWEAWEKSRQPHTMTTDETTNDKDGPVSRHVVYVEDAVGDPRFLRVILASIEKRCKLLGLYAAAK